MLYGQVKDMLCSTHSESPCLVQDVTRQDVRMPELLTCKTTMRILIEKLGFDVAMNYIT